MASLGVVVMGILAVDVSVSWKTPPGASGGRVLSAFSSLLDLPAVGNNPFFVLPAYFLPNPAISYQCPVGRTVVMNPFTLLVRGGVM